MTHLMANGQPCARPDGHPGCHRSPESYQAAKTWRKDHKLKEDRPRNSPFHNPLASRNVGWLWLAKCQNRDPDLFFPEDYGYPAGLSPAQQQAMRESRIARAKAACAICPVRLACLQDAYDLNEQYGIRGGLTAKERRKLERKSA